MFKSIIVGIDGLDGGADALAFARHLAAPDTKLALVHAYPFEHRPSRAVSLDYDALLRADAAKLLADTAPPEREATLLSVGDLSPARALHRAAEQDNADLIVIGSCRRGAAGRVLIGDVSRSALHGAPCPVAVVPRDYRQHVHPITSIGVGFDDTRESRAALDLAAAIARENGAELRVLSAVAAPMPSAPVVGSGYDVSVAREHYRVAAEQALDQAVERLDITATPELVDEAAGPALAQLSTRVGLIVTGSRGWGAAKRVVLGSTSDHVVHHASCPVIVVPGPAAESLRAESADTKHAHA